MLIYIKDGVQVSLRETTIEEQAFHGEDYVCEVKLIHSKVVIVSYYDTYDIAKRFFKMEMEELRNSEPIPF